MPRCHRSVPRVSSSRRYLARRLARSTRCPASWAASESGTRQRSLGSWTSRATTVRPRTCGSMPRRVVSTSGSSGKLLDLGFLVRDVLAHDRIELLHFELVGVQPAVLRRDVEVAGAGGGEELDLLAHGGGSPSDPSDLHTLPAQLPHDRIDAF